MTTLTLPPELDAALAEQARRRGTTPELLAVDLLRRQLLSGESPPGRTPQPQPEPPAPPGPAPAPAAEPRNLAEFLGEFIGCIRSSEHVPGGARMSVDTGKKFAEGMLRKRREGRL